MTARNKAANQRTSRLVTGPATISRRMNPIPSDQNEHRHGNPRERERRDELKAVPARRFDEPAALGHEHRVVGAGRCHDADTVALALDEAI